ncbi:MAG: rod shape-determining protein MreD, partial [Oscillospiraceae bacterium]|nr:rod shape-determining protein MreD [Oscillospiraceae bacterium]
MKRGSIKQEQRKYYLLQTLQWIIFSLLIVGAFVTATAGSFLKPMLLLPLALCISSHTGEIQATAVGMICGLLMDIACGKLLGYNAVWMVVSCVAVSLLYTYMLRQKLLNIVILTA